MSDKLALINGTTVKSIKALQTLAMTASLVSELGENAYGFNSLDQFVARQREEKPPKDPKYKKKRTRRANNHRGMKGWREG